MKIVFIISLFLAAFFAKENEKKSLIFKISIIVSIISFLFILDFWDFFFNLLAISTEANNVLSFLNIVIIIILLILITSIIIIKYVINNKNKQTIAFVKQILPTLQCPYCQKQNIDLAYYRHYFRSSTIITFYCKDCKRRWEYKEE